MSMFVLLVRSMRFPSIWVFSMILVHYLRVGRPLFTVWLLEELGVDYELKIYLRDPKTMRAQADLGEAHPLGKSPVIEDGVLKLAESGAITSYLIDTYDQDRVLAPSRDDRYAYAQYTQWLHYSEGSAFLPLLMKLLLVREKEPKPALISQFTDGELNLHLNYMSEFLGDKPFMLGDRLQGPDFGLAYIVSMAKRLGELENHAGLERYIDRMMARPAFQRAVERTGEQ